jgi:CheY-like chemotaxis protein
MSQKNVILYAEDDPDDLYIVQQAFLQYDSAIEVVHAENGMQALEFLNKMRMQGYLPCLIVLDINMPGMDGRETLVRLKNDPLFNNIPAILFTTSSSQLDKDFAAKWATDFITKPVQYADLENLAKRFVEQCDMEMSSRES